MKFTNNFTQKQILELDNFIFEGSYTNSNFVVTDKMTTPEIQYMSHQLLERGKKELKKLSQPSFTFSMDTVNFLFIEKFRPFINQLKLGNLIHAEIKKDVWLSPILLKMDIDYDNPENFTMTFGNRFRLQTSEWVFNEYYYGDIGESEVKNGICKVEIEPIFSECVNLTVGYQVFLSPYGKGNIFVSERTEDYFIVKGDFNVRRLQHLED